MGMEKGLIISYILTCPAEEAREHAEAVALEQSVELPRDAVKDQEVARMSIPDILELTPLARLPDGLTRHRLRLAFASELVGRDIPQFFNLLFGNVSLKRGLLIEDMTLPQEILGLFQGPAHGIEGIRKICSCPSGSLLCSVLKPAGSSAEVFAGMAVEFARAGVHFIKDDHGLADQPSSPFVERVRRVQRALRQEGAASIYLPNITGPHEGLEERIAFACNEGVKGFLVSPFLIGLDTFRFLRQRYPLLWMAHPAFSGAFFADASHGFRPGLLLGTLLRLLGADMVIYPDAGGRFPFTPSQCRGIADGLREGYAGRFMPAMPVPAGGISPGRARKVREFYGNNVMLLIGGGIYTHGAGREQATQEILEALRRPVSDRPDQRRREGPEQSSCENIPQGPSLPAGVTRQTEPGVWEGVRSAPYKMEGAHFQGVTRTELYVPAFAESGFDVRYFEIEPGGFSSLERHAHIHLIIGALGVGEVRIRGTCYPLAPHDIALIPKDAPHQFRNRGSIPFGFYCIVDHIRDEPTLIEDDQTQTSD